MTMRNQKWGNGAIVEINAHGHICLVQMLEFPEFAFFDPLNPGKVLFRLWVHQSAYTKGRWQKVDKKSIPNELAIQVPRFYKDIISGELSIYINGTETPAKLQDCLKLECAAVWEPEHVEDRLRDYCEKTENVWVKSMSL